MNEKEQIKIWSERPVKYWVRMRHGEYLVYCFYDLALIKADKLFFKLSGLAKTIKEYLEDKWLMFCYGKRITRLGRVVPDIEYYLIDGVVKVRKYQGHAGAWKTINGKEVRCERGIKSSMSHLVDNALEQLDDDEGTKLTKRMAVGDQEIMAHAKRGYSFAGQPTNKEYFHAYDSDDKKYPWHKYLAEQKKGGLMR